MSGDMVMASEFERIMAEAAEKDRKAAYAAGWRDCLASISKAIAESRPGDLPPIDLAAEDRREREENPGNPAGNEPAIGTIPHYVLAEVRRNPGASGAEVIMAVRDNGNKFAEPQIRTALARLEDRGLVVNRHRKWFPK